MASTKRIQKAIEFKEALESNEEDMGEMAAYHVTCEQMDVDPDDGWDLLQLAEERVE